MADTKKKKKKKKGRVIRPPGLYVDPDTGQKISTHSMIKTFRRCPKQAEYKYVERLKPKIMGRPLRLGTWMHRLEEVHALGGDWRAEHARMKKDLWDKLFDEEKADIGDLPGDAERLMTSYLWHYKDDDWIYLESEFVLECTFPDGTLYRAKIDNLVENQFGLWIVDHKWHKRLPNHGYRILDSQSGLYVWAALQNGLKVQGHIWNYGLSKPPTWPAQLKGSGLPARWNQVQTDYPTMVRWFREYFDGKLPRAYADKMRYLKSMRYQFGKPNQSPFFQRVILERSEEMLYRVAREGNRTSQRMHSYDFTDSDSVERVPDRSCTFMCSYTDLCSNELFLGRKDDATRRARFKQGDPMDYYQDEANDPEKENI